MTAEILSFETGRTAELAEGEPPGAGGRGDTEIDDLDVTVIGQHDILRLQIAVDDALAVHVI